MITGQSSRFLDVPIELRLLIYTYAILDVRTITIGTAQLEGSHADIVHRLYGDQRTPFSGIPLHHEPVVEPNYCPALLSPTTTAHIQLTPATIDPPENGYPHTESAYHTLLQLCRLVNREVKRHFAIPSQRQTSLFVQYPYGLHILHTLTPQLLQQCRSVHLAGTYVPTNFSAARAARLGPRMAPAQAKLHGQPPNFEAQLTDLTKSTFGPSPLSSIEKLELRMYYPGDDSYSIIWADEQSPTVIALRNVYEGEVTIEIWRGRHGTGVYIAVEATSEKKRVVSTVWRKLDEGRRGEAKIGSWVVDTQWPNWQLNNRISGGPGEDTAFDKTLSR